MRGFRTGALLSGALAAISVSVLRSLDFRTRPHIDRAKPDRPPPQGHSHRNGKFFWSPFGASGQTFVAHRLIVDRASNVKKIDRWLRNGTMKLPPIDERALLRHPWYRKHLVRQNLAGVLAHVEGAGAQS